VPGIKGRSGRKPAPAAAKSRPFATYWPPEQLRQARRAAAAAGEPLAAYIRAATLQRIERETQPPAHPAPRPATPHVGSRAAAALRKLETE